MIFTGPEPGVGKMEKMDLFEEDYRINGKSQARCLALFVSLGNYYSCFAILFIIASISAGVTTIGDLGKCLMFPVTRYEPSWDRATS